MLVSLGCPANHHKLGGLGQQNPLLFASAEAKTRPSPPPEALVESPEYFALSNFWGLLAFLGGCSLQSLSSYGCLFSVSLLLSVPSLLMKTLVIGFWAYLDNPGCSHFEILKLVTYAKTIFPNKFTFVDKSFEGHRSSHYSFPTFPLLTF